MKFLFSIILFSAFLLNTNAQDLIIKKNGEEIKSKIIIVDSNEVKYKKFENIDGPTYNLSRSEVFIIKYADGTKSVINRMDIPETNESKELINPKKIFREKKSYISIGYGFGTFISLINSSWLFGNNFYYDSYYINKKESYTGPVYVKYEYGISEDFGIGISLAYVKYKINYDYDTYSYPQVINNETDNYTSFSGLLRANWHFGNSDKIDPYVGFGLGFRTSTWKFSDNNSYYDRGTNNNFPLGFETTFGIKIRCSDHISVYSEAGAAKSAIQFGVTVKF